jgi:hypothetical protein
MKKRDYHMATKCRKTLQNVSATKYAQIVRNLALNSRSPRKSAALKKLGVLRRAATKVKKRLFRNTPRKQRKDALSASVPQENRGRTPCQQVLFLGSAISI